MLRSSVSTEVTMVVTQAQEELHNQLDKEVQNFRMSEGVVSHAVDERNRTEEDNVEPGSGEEKDSVEFENGKKNDVEPERDEKNDVESEQCKWTFS